MGLVFPSSCMYYVLNVYNKVIRINHFLKIHIKYTTFLEKKRSSRTRVEIDEKATIEHNLVTPGNSRKLFFKMFEKK